MSSPKNQRISDHEGDTESEDGSNSSDDENRKPIPDWAQPENLQAQIKRQYDKNSKGELLNPSVIFKYANNLNLDG
jgi:hypothetical protein